MLCVRFLREIGLNDKKWNTEWLHFHTFSACCTSSSSPPPNSLLDMADKLQFSLYEKLIWIGVVTLFK